MSEMLERVARVLWEDDYPFAKTTNAEVERCWQFVAKTGNYHKKAAAAIAAMRAPTKEMEKSGDDMTGEHNSLSVDVWTTMIDAALK